MKKKLIALGIVVLVAGIYLIVPPVNRFVNGVVSSLGLGGSQEDVTYWCPMHPEIVRKKPGVCPV